MMSYCSLWCNIMLYNAVQWLKSVVGAYLLIGAIQWYTVPYSAVCNVLHTKSIILCYTVLNYDIRCTTMPHDPIQCHTMTYTGSCIFSKLSLVIFFTMLYNAIWCYTILFINRMSLIWCSTCTLNSRSNRW